MLRFAIIALLSGVSAHQSLRSPAKPAAAPALAPKAPVVRKEPTKPAVLVNKKEDAPAEAEVKKEAKVENKAVVAKSEVKTEAKVEKKAEAKTEAKVEKKVEAKTEAKVEAKKEAKTEAKVEAKKHAESKAAAPAVLAKAEPKAAPVESAVEPGDQKVPKAKAPTVAADEAPAAEEANPALLTSSAADVYARVNFLLNRMDADAKHRNAEPAVEEEAAKVEPTAEAAKADEAKAAKILVPKAEEVKKPPVEKKVEATKAAVPKVEATKAAAPKVEATMPTAKKVEAAAKKQLAAAKAQTQALHGSPAPPKSEDSILDSTVMVPKREEEPAMQTERKVAHWVEAPAAAAAAVPPEQPHSVEEQRENSFPRDWMKNDVKYNADKDLMSEREQSIEDMVKQQRSWNTKGEAWIQTKIFHLRSWGAMAA